LAVAPCAPFLPAIPHVGDDPTPIGFECHRAFYTQRASHLAPRQARSTFGPHAIGLVRSPTVRRSHGPQARSWGKLLRCRTLIRVRHDRPAVQVLRRVAAVVHRPAFTPVVLMRVPARAGGRWTQPGRGERWCPPPARRHLAAAAPPFAGGQGPERPHRGACRRDW
jgi:hypothetical protein